jgi:hypothetical protein
MSNVPPTRAPRPWIVWVFSAIVAAIAAINVGLAWDHVAHADAYRALGVSYPPLLRAGFALIWAVVLGALAVGLARRRAWARRWILIILSNYGAFGVLWLVIYARSDFDRGRIAFQAALTALLIVLAAWMMRWRRVRRAFDLPA